MSVPRLGRLSPCPSVEWEMSISLSGVVCRVRASAAKRDSSVVCLLAAAQSSCLLVQTVDGRIMLLAT